MGQRLFADLSVSLLSLCVTLILLEIGFRLVSPQDPGFWDSQSIRRLIPTTPHFVENIPNGRADLTGVPVAINSYGLRGDEVTLPKPPRTFRIVAVGDSITFGYGIPVSDTFVKILERRLNERAHGEARYEVLNGATLGGALNDYYHFLSQKAAILQPDMILIGLCLNDILVYSESGSISEAGAEWGGQDWTLSRTLNSFLLRNSHLYMFHYARLKSFLYASGIFDINKVQGMNFLTMEAPSAYQEKAWESSLEMLSRIIAFCREHGYGIVVVVFPMQMQLSPAELQFYRNKYRLEIGNEVLSGEPQRRLQTFAEASGVTLVNLLPAYRAYNPEDLYLRNRMVLADPVHPSVKGNRIAADEIFRVLWGKLGRD